MDGSIVGDIWHQGVGQEEARYEPRDMGVVVHPRHEAKENENEEGKEEGEEAKQDGDGMQLVAGVKTKKKKPKLIKM